jgi:hypothetical protein
MHDKTLAQRFDDRNATRYRGLELQRHAFALSEFGEIGPMAREQGLVRSDDVFPVAQRCKDEVERRPVFAADKFYDDIRIGLREVERTVRPFQLGHVMCASLFAIERAHLRKQNLPACALPEIVAALGQRAHHTAAYRAQSRDRNAQRFSHWTILAVT